MRLSTEVALVLYFGHPPIPRSHLAMRRFLVMTVEPTHG
jgi:hypothetical protein